MAPSAAAPVARLSVVRPVGAPTGSTVVLAEVDGRRSVFVADEEDGSVQLVDLETHALVSTTKLGGAPGQMLLAPNGALFVAVRGASRVVELRVEGHGEAREAARHDTGDEPFGLALTPDGATLLVTSIVDPRVEAFRATDLTSRYLVQLERDPRSIAITSDGARAFVTHATSSRVSVFDVKDGAAHAVRDVSLDARERRRDFGMAHMSKPMMMPLDNDDPWDPSPFPQRASRRKVAAVFPEVRVTLHRSATQGFGLAMIGGEVLLPETLVMTSDGTEQIPTGYGSVAASTLSTHVPFVARVESASEQLANELLSGPEDKECFERKTECIVPRAVGGDGKQLFVACGKGIFESSEAGCSSCHVGDSRFTDHETHASVEQRQLFDTPSLAFVGQTAPYFHDGRFASLEALVAACDEPAVKMGHTSHLDGFERRALVAYLRSL